MWGYADNFYVQQADRALCELSLAPGSPDWDPSPLAASDILDMHEFYVAPGMVGMPVYISVNNLSGGVDLELWLFNGAAPFHTKFTAMAGVNSAGAGGDEHLAPVSFATPGYYALVVNKSKATDMGHVATYELVFKTGRVRWTRRSSRRCRRSSHCPRRGRIRRATERRWSSTCPRARARRRLRCTTWRVAGCARSWTAKPLRVGTC
jgi:hypothetical protein